MNYFGKKVLLTGADGFLGKHLFVALNKAGAEVVVYDDDVRDPDWDLWIDHELDYVFHFGSPSSQVLFKRNMGYCIETTLTSFFYISEMCKNHGVKLIYPSTGLLSYNKLNEYARCKKVCEDYHLGEGLDAMALRIYAVYGPGEERKRDYASVPYLFANQCLQGHSPVIFGDGEQVRDFIYIDDAIEAILRVADESNQSVVEIGSGVGVNFNQIVDVVNNILGEDIKPIYVDRPDNYISKTLCDPSEMHKHYLPKVNFVKGMDKLIRSLK